jgi:hypothetical protein
VACGANGEEEECMKGFGEEKWRKKPFRRTVHRCEIDINTDRKI